MSVSFQAAGLANSTGHNFKLRSCGIHFVPIIGFDDKVEKQIAMLIDSDDHWGELSQIIDSGPGVGLTTAAIIVAELPELGSLNRQQARALVGVAPLPPQVGHTQRQTVYIVAYMRKLLSILNQSPRGKNSRASFAPLSVPAPPA